MAEEAACITPVEPVVGGLAVSLVCDDAVVAALLDLVRNDDGPRVRASSLHGLVRTGRHLSHALLSRVHVRFVLLILVILVHLSARQSNKSLSFLTRCWLL